MRAQTPNLAQLYSGLSLEDSSAIVTELQTLNVLTSCAAMATRFSFRATRSPPPA
jgi:hypothetical protein